MDDGSSEPHRPHSLARERRQRPGNQVRAGRYESTDQVEWRIHAHTDAAHPVRWLRPAPTYPGDGCPTHRCSARASSVHHPRAGADAWLQLAWPGARSSEKGTGERASARKHSSQVQSDRAGPGRIRQAGRRQPGDGSQLGPGSPGLCPHHGRSGPCSSRGVTGHVARAASGRPFRGVNRWRCAAVGGHSVADTARGRAVLATSPTFHDRAVRRTPTFQVCAVPE